MGWPKGKPRGVTPGAGRKPGIPNKATTDARASIAAFVEGNTPRLQGWLDQVAKGVLDKDGNYVIRPDPVRAFTMVQDIIEYHVPKLQRIEGSGEAGEHVVKLIHESK